MLHVYKHSEMLCYKVGNKCSLLSKADVCMEEGGCAQRTSPISVWKLPPAAVGSQHALCCQTLRAQVLIWDL